MVISGRIFLYSIIMPPISSALQLVLSPEKGQVRDSVSPRFEHPLFEVRGIARADADFRNVAILAAVPRVLVMGARVSHVRIVVSIVGLTAAVDNYGVALVLERPREGSIIRVFVCSHEIGGEIDLVKVPCDSSGGFLDISYRFVEIKSAETET